MKAIIWQGVRNITIEEKPVQSPGDGEVLVQMKALGLCGSDVKLYHDGILGTLKPTKPFIMGHEGTGIVTDLGKGIRNIRIGNRISINPQAACGKCFYCTCGDQNLCQNLNFKSVTTDGVFSEFVVIREDQAILLGDDISFIRGTTIEPLSVAVQASRLAPLTEDSKVVIIGAGTIGLVLLLLLRSMGINAIATIDQLPHALDLAQRCGADLTLNSLVDPELSALARFFNNPGPDIVFETAGSPATQALPIDIVRPGGTCIMVGITAEEKTAININRVVRSNLKILGSVRTSKDTFQHSANLINMHVIDPTPIISKVFPFNAALTAFELVLNRSNQLTKCILSLEE